MVALIILACIVGYLGVMETTRRLIIRYYDKNFPNEHMGIWDVAFVFVPIWNVLALFAFVILSMGSDDVNCDRLFRRHKQSK